MSTNSGITTKRTLAVENYKGFDIIRVKVTTHEYSHVLHRYVEWGKTTTHFDFCATGNIKKPSMHYEVYAKSVEDCKERIDKFIEDDSTCFTAGERQKYIYTPNHKNSWGFNYESLMKLMKQHQKAEKRIQILLEDRLEDANYHSYCGLLCEKRYKEFEELAAKELTFNEKFEVYLYTKRKPIKDVERLTLHIKDAIEEYFKTHCMDVGETDVEVKYIKDW